MSTSPDQASTFELTIVMPCLNEAETVAQCVGKGLAFLRRAGVHGEVLVADNGSADGSQALALAAGARVVHVQERGYGAALLEGIKSAQSRFVIMGDADDSYDFSALDGLLTELRGGADLVMGNRFLGGIQPGAMPLLHRYLGNPVLSFIGRLLYRVPVGDFHCGLRGFSREAVMRLNLHTPGMEFASEMVVKSALHGLKIAEVPVTLSPDGRSRPPHLRTWRDGWRHLRFLLLFSPRWLFLVPGLLMTMLGITGFATLALHGVKVGNIGLDIHTLVYAGASVVLGYQMLLFAVFSKYLGITHGWLPPDERFARRLSRLTLERCLVLAGALMLVGILLSIEAVGSWSAAAFGPLDPSVTMRWVVPAVTAMALGGESFLAAFFLEALRLGERGKLAKRPLPVGQEIQQEEKSGHANACQ
ncbi:glycosyltransferase family 2 protein [Aquabacterium sp. A7-Y]|uniref:glycosyltransferase family 2 protein n=1 Tax=Aquabacterium sp. A7-Y TaxID=1349605 RepID=UPI00223E1953|nr:glycosyltransferase family 2 protein [Aquabacterium sp. A7-Y]MCW7538973.1 glycosyltransferase family 2 protein [Aquabacterium sp. A7-Y]